ncbi:MAG: PH domain-containing protein [bacterium]
MSEILLEKQNLFFEGKEDEEDVILVLHRHWYTLSGQIYIVAILATLPFIALVALSKPIVEYNLISVFSFLWIVYYLLLWFRLFYVICMYVLDNWIVTTKRIVDSLQNGFFHRSVAELQLSKIQDVSYKVNGIMPTFFNYGTVEIQTAGKEVKFLFQNVPNPQRIKDIIMELILEEEEDKEERHDDLHGRISANHVLVEEDGKPTPLTTDETEIINNNTDEVIETEALNNEVSMEEVQKNEVILDNTPTSTL